jgi:hypothetical protein
MKEIKLRQYGLHVHICNRTKKPLAVVFSVMRRGTRESDSRSDLANVQYKPTWNCHNAYHLCNKYILIKINEKKRNYAA